jgi:hypothetical protein
MLKKLRVSALAAMALLVALSLATVQAASSLSTTRVSFGFSGGMAGGPALGTTTFTLAENWAYTLTNGSGANNASKIYVATASTTTIVDLDSTLTFADGSTGSFSRIVAVAIKPGASNAAALALKGDFILTKYLTPAGDTLANMSIPIHKTGGFTFVAPDATGVAVTATTGDELNITVSGTDSFSLIVIGS